jgi:hypothetical protein
VKLDHWWSSRSDLNEELVGEKVETYLKNNGFHYFVVSPDTYMEGIIVRIDEIGSSDFPGRTEEIAKISNFAYFLFDKLKLKKNCLHFIIGRTMINGEGKPEGSINALDDVTFTELTGEILPRELRGTKTLDELFEWIRDLNSKGF